jgi:site-specific DNA recombinase
VNFAFYGRVSTEDQQDPASSKQWQLSRAKSLIEPTGGIVVSEFFDIGQSRSIPWKRRPESSRLLNALRNSDRTFEGVVIGEPARAFYGSQFGETFPILDHYGIELWVPEVGGRVDPGSDAHDMLMNLYGGMAKGERNRIKTRVRSAMSAQARHEGRFLGGRPPYGYQLADAGPHPNPSKAADGKRLHQLELDPVASPVVRRIFDEYLSGTGIYAIAEGLTRDGIPSPSAHDPARNRHRQTSRGAWGKSAVRAILRNPRYTGHEVWNKQRRDEVLIDVDDVALGNTSKMRWNDEENWVFSEQPVHEAIIDSHIFERAGHLASGRRQIAPKTRRARHPYLLRGIIFCGGCGRRMQGSWNNACANYRCRFPTEYAAKAGVDHPRNVYVREDVIEPLLDKWLSEIFDAGNVLDTYESMAAAHTDSSDLDADRREAARRTVSGCDRRLNQYRQLLDEGADPKVVAGWMAEVQAERVEAEKALTRLRPQQVLTVDDVRHMVDNVEDKVRMLAEADPATKTALYAALGVRLTYDHQRKTMVVESQPRSWALDRVGGGT